jgi:hypothetical protein
MWAQTADKPLAKSWGFLFNGKNYSAMFCHAQKSLPPPTHTGNGDP